MRSHNRRSTAMPTRESDKRIDPLVFSLVEQGIKVYSARDPKKSYIVSGTPEAPTCTCPDYQHHAGEAQQRCKHILLASGQLYKWYTEQKQSGPYEDEERKAIQEEGSQPEERSVQA